MRGTWFNVLCVCGGATVQLGHQLGANVLAFNVRFAIDRWGRVSLSLPPVVKGCVCDHVDVKGTPFFLRWRRQFRRTYHLFVVVTSVVANVLYLRRFGGEAHAFRRRGGSHPLHQRRLALRWSRWSRWSRHRQRPLVTLQHPQPLDSSHEWHQALSCHAMRAASARVGWRARVRRWER